MTIERLRLADGQPLALDTVWLPAAVARPLLDIDWSRTALYDELEARCGVTLDGGWERIRPVIVDDHQRELLQIDADVAGFRVERRGCAGDEVVEWRETLVRGDRYEFISSWRPSADPGLALRPAGVTP